MFNQSQQEAISHEKGAVMVLAGPGTGKTTVITHRVKRLILKKLALPEEILVVTFTKAAAVEMQERFEKIMESEAVNVNVCFGTFHSIFLGMLRTSSMKGCADHILSDEKRNKIIKEIVMRIHLEVPDMWEFVRSVSGEISKVKGNGIQIEHYKNNVCDEENFIKIFRSYERALEAENIIDFDDMILKCQEMLKSNRELLEYWKNKYKYILIDEFQDINRMQYENIKMLAGLEGNIFVVGDDDQSIYGFRGSKPDIMFEFQRDFKDVKTINLQTNYRSNSEILKVSQNLISHNVRRFAKNIVSENGNGGQVEIREFENNISEYKYMAECIRKYLDAGIPPEEIAILVRNHNGMPVIRNFLVNKRIESKEKKRNSLYSSKIARDIISYVQAAENGIEVSLKKNQELLSVINKPERFISRQVIGECDFNLNDIEKAYSKSPEVLKNINELKMHLKMIRGLEPFAAVNYIRYGVNYEKYMKEYAMQGGFRFVDLEKIYDSVKQDASGFATNREWLQFVDEKNDITIDNKNAVNIITMHASKGLEYKVVFLPDVNQGVMPSAKALREADISEERRLMYVAITRASKYLHVYSVKNAMGRKCHKSQFINEMCSCLQF